VRWGSFPIRRVYAGLGFTASTVEKQTAPLLGVPIGLFRTPSITGQAQSFKRACSCFGLGRYFYNFAEILVDLDEYKHPREIPVEASWALAEREQQAPAQNGPEGERQRDGRRTKRSARRERHEQDRGVPPGSRTDALQQYSGVHSAGAVRPRHSQSARPAGSAEADGERRPWHGAGAPRYSGDRRNRNPRGCVAHASAATDDDDAFPGLETRILAYGTPGGQKCHAGRSCFFMRQTLRLVHKTAARYRDELGMAAIACKAHIAARPSHFLPDPLRRPVDHHT